MKFLLKAALILALLSFGQIKLFAQSEQIKNTQKVLAAIILNRILDNGHDKGSFYILKKNFPLGESINSIQKNRKIKIELIDEPLLAEEIYFFEPFSIKGHSATVVFGYSFRSSNREFFNKNIYYFACRKKRGKWGCRLSRVRSTIS